ncbi:unnamed protein product [marine sediment metagenome]|uniref:Uncharacterized protein n=1 Tax=marine sediment metagenome TaxID=412755 RepID=X1D3K8_9ZZZZ
MIKQMQLITITISSCDICGKQTEFLVDYFSLLCQDCKNKYEIGELTLQKLKEVGIQMNKKHLYQLNKSL